MNYTQDALTSTKSLRPWISIGLAVLGIVGIFVTSALVSASGIDVHANTAINHNILYQSAMTMLALIVLGLLYALYPQNFRRFMHFGDMQAVPEPVPQLAINEKDTWRGVGINFTVIVTIATSVFLYLGVWNPETPATALLTVLPWALLFAVTNSFVEEVLTRFTVVFGLYGTLENRYIYLISALVFGIPHFFGTPGGVIGTMMAGFMGWLLAKSIIETRGIFWAWFIHFLQDVLIFAVLFAIVS